MAKSKRTSTQSIGVVSGQSAQRNSREHDEDQVGGGIEPAEDSMMNIRCGKLQGKRKCDAAHQGMRQKRQVVLEDRVTGEPGPLQYIDDSDPSVIYSSDSEDSAYWEETGEDSEGLEDDTEDEVATIGANNNYAEDIKYHSPASLKWTSGAGEYLRGSYGHGSRATKYREQKRQEKRLQEGSEHYSIKALFKRQQDLNLSLKGVVDQTSDVIPLNTIDHGKLPGPFTNETAQLEAMEDLKRLVELPTEQKRKYGNALSESRNFYRRHLLVLNFLWIQQQRKNFPGLNRRRLAETVAASNKRGSKTARKIIQWEKSWVEQRTIPERKSKNMTCSTSWMNEEDIACAARDFARSQREGK